ncbi:MAG: SAM-dependent methyltransferase [Acidimicrobiales bacterium]|jgi:methyltransferase (TIGR00027 family)
MREGHASRTARQNALFRALEARRPPGDRVANDPLAARFLTPEFRGLADLAYLPPVRRLLEVVIDHRWPCARAGVVARTRLIDETILGVLPRVEQVIILGAGFDTRPYRLEGMESVAVFELDHPATQEAKRDVLRRRGALPTQVSFVAVVFGRDDPARELANAGFKSDRPTLVLWEGVTNYLDANSVSATFEFLAAAIATGSVVVFTYVDRGMPRRHGRLCGRRHDDARCAARG